MHRNLEDMHNNSRNHALMAGSVSMDPEILPRSTICLLISASKNFERRSFLHHCFNLGQYIFSFNTRPWVSQGAKLNNEFLPTHEIFPGRTVCRPATLLAPQSYSFPFPFPLEMPQNSARLISLNLAGPLQRASACQGKVERLISRCRRNST